MFVYQTRMMRLKVLMMLLPVGAFSPAVCMVTSDEAKSRSLVAGIIGGAAAGAADVAVAQPLTYWKNMRQTGGEISRNPRMWYSGGSVQMLNMVPTGIIQVSTEDRLKKVFSGSDVVSGTARSLISGVISAPAAAITNSLVLYMQQNKSSMSEAVRTLYNAGGCAALMRGLGPVAVREGLYTAGYLDFYPRLSDFCSRVTGNEFVGGLASGVITGVGISVLTQPFDTVATQMQNDYNAKTAKTVMQTMARISCTEGLRGYYRGMIPRAGSIIIGITVMGTVTAEVKEAVHRLTE